MKPEQRRQDSALGEHFPLIFSISIVAGIATTLVADSPILGAACGIGLLLVLLGTATLLARHATRPRPRP